MLALGDAMIMVQNMAILILAILYGARIARREQKAREDALLAQEGLRRIEEQVAALRQLDAPLAPDPYRVMQPVLVLDDDATRKLMQEWAEYFQHEKTYKDHRTSQQRLRQLVEHTEQLVERASRAN